MKLNLNYASILFILFALMFSSCSKSDSEPIEEEPIVEEPIEEPVEDPVATDSLKDYEVWTGMQIVLFTPSDIEEPEDFNERMKEVVDYTEWFFSKWMNHWGYTVEDPIGFKKDDYGYPIVWRTKGEKTSASGEYDALGYAKTEVIPNTIKEYEISEDNQLWWVISYPGPTSSAYRGSGSSQSGYANANFIPNLGQLILPEDDNLGGGAALDFKLKAMIHEMTHGLGLPHVGPIIEDGFGNSLMGGTNAVYAKQYPGDERVYLTKATAAMLWKHPLFSGEYSSVDPTVSVSNLVYSYDATEDMIVVSGTLESDVTAHSIVVSNDASTDKSEYWRKMYAERLNSDNSFTCSIPSPSQCDGTLEIVFCFDNGHISGVTGTDGFGKTLDCNYVYQDGTFIFSPV